MVPTESPPGAADKETKAEPPGIDPSVLADLRLIGPRDLALILGVSINTVRKWMAAGPDAGLVPLMLRINGQVRFRPRDVEAYLVSREVR